MQSDMIYSAPWAERDAAGVLRPYGPTATTYQRQVARHRNWALRMPSQEARREQDLDRICAYLREHGSELPDGERRAAELVFGRGHSVRWVARELGLSRRTVRTQLDRVRDKAGRHKRADA